MKYMYIVTIRNKNKIPIKIFGVSVMGPYRPRYCVCVVLHKMLWTYQDRADMAPTPGNDVAAEQNEQVLYVQNENYRNPSRKPNINKNYSRTTLITWGHWLGRRTGSNMRQPTTLGAEAGIYQSFSGLLSVLFKTYQLFQELLFTLLLLKVPTNFQTKSNLFPTIFKSISKQITSPLFKTLNQIYVQIRPP